MILSLQQFYRSIQYQQLFNCTDWFIFSGHAAYGAGVKFQGSDKNRTVGATYYMTYHTVLQKDQDYIDALNYSLSLAKGIEQTIKSNCTTCGDVAVFPYR